MRRRLTVDTIAIAHLLAIACLAAGFAHADIVPGIGNMDFDIHSRDPNPIQVDFTHPKKQLKLEQATIPRAYIVFANVKRAGRNTPLPDKFGTNHIKIAFTDGDGLPWNDGVAKRSEMARVSPQEAAEQLRPQQYIAALRSVANPNRRNSSGAFIASHERQANRHEGLIHYKFSTGDIYIGNASDAFESIRCMAQLNPNYFCQYTIDISDQIVAEVSFLDFRLHGGRDYANRRARFVREVVCGFTDACTASRKPAVFVGDQKRNVCIKHAVPQKNVTISFSRNITPNMPIYKARPEWFDEVKDLFWRLKMPASFSTKAAADRPEITTAVMASFIFPQMAQTELVSYQLRQALEATVGDEKQTQEGPCTEYAEISFEEVGAQKIFVELNTPLHRSRSYNSLLAFRECEDFQGKRASDLDFDIFIACRQPDRILFRSNEKTMMSCPIFSNTGGDCSLIFDRDGWPLRVSFRAKQRTNWRAIQHAVNALLDETTVSRDPIRLDANEHVKP